MSIQKCIICSREFRVFPSRKRVYCSRVCMGVGQKKRRGENNPNWKADKVKYQGLHKWVRENYGKPNYCESKSCSGKSKRYNWASKDGTYGRSRKFWLRLCRSCHLALDWKRETHDKRRVELRKRMINNNNAKKWTRKKQ